ncbi:hypothetical protein C7H08_05680 [Marinobacter halophilus]|uniref:Uncharacterized protein n=2 Tax=Marinobacter halophilus TaxID=1323740 RepID=A0A2T1KG45_9GAMM|nr:hypothetical protein C7H08_05680 [Marinobacter halophilus]
MPVEVVPVVRLVSLAFRSEAAVEGHRREALQMELMRTVAMAPMLHLKEATVVLRAELHFSFLVEMVHPVNRQVAAVGGLA